MHWLPSAALLANFLAQAPSVDAGLIGWRRGVVAASHGHLQSDSQSQVGTNAGALVKDNPETGEETLECVHVSNPVLAHHGIMAGSEAVDLPDDVPDYCQLVLVDYVFANSDGRPFIGICFLFCSPKAGDFSVLHWWRRCEVGDELTRQLVTRQLPTSQLLLFPSRHRCDD